MATLALNSIRLSPSWSASPLRRTFSSTPALCPASQRVTPLARACCFPYISIISAESSTSCTRPMSSTPTSGW